MNIDFRTDLLPPTERLALLREHAANLPEPIDVRTAAPETLVVRMVHRSVGEVTASSFTTATGVSILVTRTERLIRRSDPEEYRFLYSSQGHTGLTQRGRDTMLGPGELAIYDTSHPHRGWRAGGGADATLWMLAFPRRLLHMDENLVACATGTRLPDGPAARLIAAMLPRVVADAANYGNHAAAVLASVVDLIGALLADTADETLPESSALVTRTQRYIDAHLDDPGLSPAIVAAAHHIGVRTLHRRYAAQGLTVAGWIRDRRLDRARRDLATTSLPVATIAARWQFADAGHLSRVFRAAYGCSPREYRAR